MINISRLHTSVVLKIKSEEGGDAFYRFEKPADLLDIGISLIKDSLLLAADQEEQEYPFKYIFKKKDTDDILDDFVRHVEGEITSDPTLYDDLELVVENNNDSDNDSNDDSNND